MKHLVLACLCATLSLSAMQEAFAWGAVRGPNGGAAYRGPMGGAAVRGPDGGAAVRAPAGGAAYRPPGGGGAYYEVAIDPTQPPELRLERPSAPPRAWLSAPQPRQAIRRRPTITRRPWSHRPRAAITLTRPVNKSRRRACPGHQYQYRCHDG